MLSEFRKLLKDFNSFLNEERVDNIIAQYPDFRNEILELKAEGVPEKYYTWVIKQLIINKQSDMSMKSIKLISSLVKTFDLLRERNQLKVSDINRYTLRSMKDAVEITKHDYDKKQEAAETKKVFENEKWLMFQPLNLAASCRYGNGTKWCISGKNDNKFLEYTEKGDRYLFCFDKTNKKKYAVQVDGDGDVYFYDEADTNLPHSAFPKVFTDEASQDAIINFTGNDLLFDF